jgi:hypothetical protein
VYGPLYLYWFWLSLRSRSFFFFNASNPSIKNGGFLMESKFDIYRLMPSHCYPKTLFFPQGTKPSVLPGQLCHHRLSYPLLAKPDIGMKGMSVQKLENEQQMLDYARNATYDFLVQEFIDYPEEAGIFYYRIPGENRGCISGIAGKEFLAVRGNGRATIRELLQLDKRFVLQIPILQKTLGNDLNAVLEDGKEQVLVPYGNHVRGTKFVDISHRISEQLLEVIDGLCRQIDGFHYGRLDVRYKSWEDLCAGENFSVIEVNGAGSEPAHIYDPNHSIFFAWKEILRHWSILWKISHINHLQSKAAYMSTKEGLAMLRENNGYMRGMREGTREEGRGTRDGGRELSACNI